MPDSDEYIIWLDLEMTGLDPEQDVIMELACVVTSKNLKTLNPTPFHAVLHCPDDVLFKMNDWCQEMHKSTGLVEECRKSENSLQQVEDRCLQYLRNCGVPEKGCPFAGNSVHVDVAFLRRHMPRLYAFAHYRIIDVSTVSELCRRWYKNAYHTCKEKQKKNQNGSDVALRHRALYDVYRSIQVLKNYRHNIFR